MTSNTNAGRTIERELTVSASLERAYWALSEPEGWRSWLIEDGEIESLPDGWLHLKWSMGAKVQVKILESRPNENVVMEWYAPSEPGRTTVIFRVSRLDDGTLVRLTESGFGQGDDWDRCYEATNEVWDFGLGRLQEALKP